MVDSDRLISCSRIRQTPGANVIVAITVEAAVLAARPRTFEGGTPATTDFPAQMKRQNVTVAWLEQVWVPALHTWYVYVAWLRPPGESV